MHRGVRSTIPPLLLRQTLITGRLVVYRVPAGGLAGHREVNEERSNTKAARDPPASLRACVRVGPACLSHPALPFLKNIGNRGRFPTRPRRGRNALLPEPDSFQSLKSAFVVVSAD